MARITQLAKELGLSAATVSRALSRPEMVAQKTRDRIIAKAHELGIDIVDIAAGAHGQDLIGVVIADLNNSFSAGILNSITALAEDDGMRVVLGVSHENLQLERKILSDFNIYRLKGIIAMPASNSSTIDTDCSNIVAVDRPFAGRQVKCALIDNFLAVKLAYDHLIAKGHSHIVYISGKSSLYTFRERLAAAQSFTGVECIELDALEYNDLYTKAFEIANILLTRHTERPTAILTANNAITSGVVYALSLRNMQMPKDMALVSIGDPEWCRFYPCPITAVKLPENELGLCAYELLKHNEKVTRLITPMLLPRASS